MILTGVNSFFFPFNEIEILHPLTGQPHVGNDHADVFIEADDPPGLDDDPGRTRARTPDERPRKGKGQGLLRALGGRREDRR